MAKIKIEDIKKEVEQDGWLLVSSEYINLDTEMIFKCPEGHTVMAPWKKLRNKRECPVCVHNKYNIQDDKITPKKKGTHRILALDQATKISGYTIMDSGELIKYGTFAATGDDEIERDNKVKMWLLSMIANWKPDSVALEGIQFQDEINGQKTGVTTFETLARLQGILMETLYEEKIDYKICPTQVWRKHCGVKGRTRADKKTSMRLLVKQWYDVSVSEDEADSIGICKYATETQTKQPEIIMWE